jgi:Polymerase beta, Nucleotidyltransferase
VSNEVQAHYDFANLLVQHLQNDERIQAIWLEGSLGRGTADAHSDIDLHMLVSNATIIRQELPMILENIQATLFYLPLGFGAMSAMVMFDNFQKLEVWLDETPPPIYLGRAKVLFDRTQQLQLVPIPPTDLETLRTALEQCLGNFWFGFLSKVERTGSGQLIAAMRGLSDQVDYFITVKILEQGKFRDSGGSHYNEYISLELRRELEAVLTMPALSPDRLVQAHWRLANLMQTHGPNAAKQIGATYPQMFEDRALVEASKYDPAN